MPRPLYVLGAGFSHNFNGGMFPLISNFLKTAKERSIYQPEGQHGPLASVVSKYFDDPTYPDIEKVLSFLSASSLHDRQIPSEHRAIIYDELVEVIVHLLSQASDSRAKTDAVQVTYQNFASVLNDSKATIITFNYDLLIEKLLARHRWQRYYGYGAHIPGAYAAMPTSPHTFQKQQLSEDTDVRWSDVTLLKLHGSINWGIPTIAEEDSKAIYQLPLSGGLGSMGDFAIRTDFGSPFTLNFKPAIIPPVLDKSFWLRNPTFRVLWNMAMEAINNAELITFIGYSLPVTDFMAEFMFRQGINLHSRKRKIVVVDPKISQLRTRYRDVFSSVSLDDISFRDSDFVTYANEMLTSEKPRGADASSS